MVRSNFANNVVRYRMMPPSSATFNGNPFLPSRPPPFSHGFLSQNPSGAPSFSQPRSLSQRNTPPFVQHNSGPFSHQNSGPFSRPTNGPPSQFAFRIGGQSMMNIPSPGFLSSPPPPSSFSQRSPPFPSVSGFGGRCPMFSGNSFNQQQPMQPRSPPSFTGRPFPSNYAHVPPDSFSSFSTNSPHSNQNFRYPPNMFSNGSPFPQYRP